MPEEDLTLILDFGAVVTAKAADGLVGKELTVHAVPTAQATSGPVEVVQATIVAATPITDGVQVTIAGDGSGWDAIFKHGQFSLGPFSIGAAPTAR